MKKIHIIGGGLAGPEAALQAAAFGCNVTLSEMRPLRSTEAHQTADFAELVCSNSLKSESENTAPWLLKQEMRRANSFLLAAADASAVPAGHALAVDRIEFSRRVAEKLEHNPRITIQREEITRLDEDGPDTITVLATGPLTSSPLAAELQRLTGADHLAFYDSISPIVDASTIDMDKVYFAARWDKGTPDYINCPFTKEEYDRFLDALTSAEEVQSKEWEQIPSGNSAKLRSTSEGCLPHRGNGTPRPRHPSRFGPMKPAGLTNPRTGKWPFAVVQLRQENLRADSYNLVGFQNHLKFGEQARVLRLIPGLENATFLRYGQIHRNTYIHAPSLLNETLQLKQHPNILIAGQLSGVKKAYTRRIHRLRPPRRTFRRRPRTRRNPSASAAPHRQRLPHALHHARGRKALPARQHHLRSPRPARRRSSAKKVRDKKERHRIQCERALAAWNEWLEAGNRELAAQT